MNVLCVANVYVPEVAPLANRLSEHAREWVRAGHTVEVLTANPNYPEGFLHEGYQNRFSQEERDGVTVTRVPQYLAPNKGRVRRTLSYVSFMFSVIAHAWRLRHRPDVVVGSSPTLFAALGAFALARLRRAPFVLEVRDLWPESILAVEAAREGTVMRLFSWLARLLYGHADHVVVLTDAFKERLLGLGVEPERLSVIKNGADLGTHHGGLSVQERDDVRERHGLRGFVAAFIGTVGMAHRADVLLDAAASCKDPNVLWLVVGAGAEFDALQARAQRERRDNFLLLPRQAREEARRILEACDCSVIHLRDAPVFETVLPSKLFESMAAARPIVLGVRGEASRLVLGAGAGLVFTPERVEELVAVVTSLKAAPREARDMGARGRLHVEQHFDRARLAADMCMVLERVAGCGSPRLDMPSVRPTV